MGNEASLIKKCTVAPKPRHSTTEWSLYDASYASQQYSLFIFSDDRYFNDITRWKHIRHPNLVKCYEAGLCKGKKCILTEPISPVRLLLEEMHQYVKLSGLFNIGEALSFLHQICGISVNNLSIDSVFVSRNDCNECWKLGSLYWYSSLDTDSEEFFRQLIGFHTSHGTIKTLPPEDREVSTHLLIRSSKLVHRRDAYAFVSLINELLYDPKNPPKLADMILASECEVSSLSMTIKSFVDNFSPIPADQRPTVAELLNNKLFVNCIFLQIRQFFINFGTHNDYEKCHFFETFIERLRMLPDRHLIVNIFTMIVSSRVIMSSKFIYNQVMPYFLIPSKYEQKGQPALNNGSLAEEGQMEEAPNGKDESGQCEPVRRHYAQEQAFTLTNGQVVTLSPIISTSIYREYIIPHLSNLYCVHDYKIRMLLLLYLPHYGPLIAKTCLRKIILPQILLGIKDSDNELVSLTFRSLAVLVDNFGVVTVLGGSKRPRIFNSGVPRSDVRLSSSDATSQHDSEDNRDNLSTISAKSTSSVASSSLNFLGYKMPAHMISERSSPDGDEIDSAGHLLHSSLMATDGLLPASGEHVGSAAASSKALLRASSNNINLIEDDEEWPEWDNGHSSSSNGFETAVESLESSEANQSISGDTGPVTPTNTADKRLPTVKPESSKAIAALTKKMQTFDIKEIDFKQVEHKEIDNLFLDMEPVFDFRQSKLEVAQQQTVSSKRTESPVARANLNLFELKLDAQMLTDADDLENSSGGWNDEDTLEGELGTEEDENQGQSLGEGDEKVMAASKDSSVEISELSEEHSLPCMLAQSSSEG